MAIFVTSDLHFGHDKDFLYGPRGFNSIEEHDEAIIERWNAIVDKDDDVYVLGDVMLGDNALGYNKLLQLNGNIYIVAGNHDTDNRINYYKNPFFNIRFLGFGYRLKYGKWTFMLSHYPSIVANFDEDVRKLWNLHGHTHSPNKFNEYPHCYNVNMDAHNCTPVLIEDIIKDIKEVLTNEINTCEL